jgi:uncharacterized damage-inducible protein DinB
VSVIGGEVTDAAHAFIDESRRLLRNDYLPKIEACLGRLTDEEVWARPNEASNSIGNLLLHLCGNVRQWIVGGVAKREVERQRQQEFDERRHLPARDLQARLKSTLDEADAVLANLDPGSLLARRTIQGYDVTVLQAVYHVVEHFGMHTGQIIVLTKARKGDDLKLWQPPPPTAGR